MTSWLVLKSAHEWLVLKVPGDIIPAAERWGFGDGILRIEAFRNAAAADVAELRRLVREHEPALDEWLAGPEHQSYNPSPEYHLRYVTASRYLMNG